MLTPKEKYFSPATAKFHCLVHENLCQTLPVVRADTQVHPEREYLILQKAPNKGVVRSWTVKLCPQFYLVRIY